MLLGPLGHRQFWGAGEFACAIVTVLGSDHKWTLRAELVKNRKVHVFLLLVHLGQ